MSSVNKTILLGNLGKDPEIRVLENGSKVANFSMATTESYKNKSGERVENTEWHNVVFWGKIVDVIEKYLKKGSKIYLEGKLKTRSYEHEGVKKYTTEVFGNSLVMLGGRQGEAVPENNSAVADPDDDLPF